ncbi:MAG: hypothetical protein GWO02_01370, partial [Gammaproteobacteria bacterium]|nr:hypothetical protein [Gammaproteobacteria bacterium]
MYNQQQPLHALSVRRALQRLDADAERGLEREEVRERRQAHGRNELRHVARRGPWAVLLS